MDSRKLVVLFVSLAISALAYSPAAAQGVPQPQPGSTELQVWGGSDLSTTTSLDLFSRLRIGTLSTMYSWGRGTTVRPGLLRSSIAVLRERRGLMLR